MLKGTSVWSASGFQVADDEQRKEVRERIRARHAAEQVEQKKQSPPKRNRKTAISSENLTGHCKEDVPSALRTVDSGWTECTLIWNAA